MRVFHFTKTIFIVSTSQVYKATILYRREVNSLTEIKWGVFSMGSFLSLLNGLLADKKARKSKKNKKRIG
jgi:hypothetical protein